MLAGKRLPSLALGASLGFLGALSLAAHAQDTQPRANQIAAAHGKPYDQVANCLMRRMAGRQFAAWPLVYAPPRKEALVNVWPRGRDTEPPAAVFSVVQDADGMTRVGFQQSPGAAGPGVQAAEAAARQCLR
jgi:hypothetical protein